VNERDTESVDLARLCAQTGDDEQATEILILDVGDVLGVAGYFVVMSASNRRLVRTLAERVEERAQVDLGRRPLRHEGLAEQQWVLLDYGDVIVHIFLDEIRRFYEIERLYTDVDRIDWQR